MGIRPKRKRRTWKDSILIYIDLIGIKRLAESSSIIATNKMRTLHTMLNREMRSGYKSVEHVYAWNDAVLLVIPVRESSQDYENALHEADVLKQHIDAISQSFAVAVKGRPFPKPARKRDNRTTIILASSFAMANCFAIEAHAKNNRLRAMWYIDVRIARKVARAKSLEWTSVQLLPSNLRRRVYMKSGYLWPPNESETVSG